jgi:hypothetical protein
MGAESDVWEFIAEKNTAKTNNDILRLFILSNLISEII